MSQHLRWLSEKNASFPIELSLTSENILIFYFITVHLKVKTI